MSEELSTAAKIHTIMMLDPNDKIRKIGTLYNRHGQVPLHERLVVDEYYRKLSKKRVKIS